MMRLSVMMMFVMLGSMFCFGAATADAQGDLTLYNTTEQVSQNVTQTVANSTDKYGAVGSLMKRSANSTAVYLAGAANAGAMAERDPGLPSWAWSSLGYAIVLSPAGWYSYRAWKSWRQPGVGS